MTSDEVSIEVIKSQIKEWEHVFVEEHSKKPSKDDIKEAPSNIKELYKIYWKFKSRKPNLHGQKEDVAWSSCFNKVNQESIYGNSNVQNVSQGFCEKLKKQANREVCFSSKQLKVSISCDEKKNVCTFSNENNDNGLKSAKREKKLSKTHSILKPFDFISQPVKERAVIEKGIAKELIISGVNTHTNTYQSQVKQINIFSSSSTKSLHFQAKVNDDWLKRCFATNVRNDENPPEFQLQNCNESEIFPSEDFSLNLHKKDVTMAPVNCKESLSNSVTSVQERGRNIHPNTVADILLQSKSIVKYAERILPSINVEHADLHVCNFQEQKSITLREGESKEMKASDRKRFRSPSPENFDVPNTRQCTRSHYTSSGVSEMSLYIPDNPLLERKRGVSPLSKKAKESDNTFKKVETLSLPPPDYSNSANLKKTAHLTKKITSGTLNENFIRINMKKKHFARGHRKVNVKKMKWQKWKSAKQNASCSYRRSVSNTDCFRCGEIGHWANKCPLNKKIHTLNPDLDDFDAPLPTLEEAEALYKGSFHINENRIETKEVKLYCTEKEKQSLDNVQNMSFDVSSDNTNCITEFTDESSEYCKNAVFPLFSQDELSDIPPEVLSGLKNLGYSKFREGQDKAVMRMLCGLSTLVILPTGAGKSLCYQLPAYLYAQKFKCITLVISPLVSLMEDQMKGVSSHLHIVSLHGTMTVEERKKSLDSIFNGTAQILLVSPETVIGGKGYLPTDLPPIAFACIDEAHCLSEWSHNFRPSYLQLYKVLKQKYRVRCILGLTATATKAIAADISHHLDLKSCENSVIGCTTVVPQNLHLSVSRDIDKDWALIKLLKGDRFKQSPSIIIYCIRRDETERIATLIRTCMQDEGTDKNYKPQNIKNSKNKSNLIWTAGAYHAGLEASKRRSIQKQFMHGKLRVVVATIAFGMGLNKSDVRAIIHYNMPKSFESYVQEIGRAGRDGVDSHCHLFLHSENSDICELKRHIHANGIDRITIKKLLKKIFIPCNCPTILQSDINLNLSKQNVTEEKLLLWKEMCPKHELAFPLNTTIEELDLKEENISTLLCYLELHPGHWIELLPPTYATCTIHCYGGPNQLYQLAQKYPMVAMALAHGKLCGNEWDGTSNTYQFQIIDLASHMDLKSGQLKREFKKLEWNDQKRRTGVIVEFSVLAFHLHAPGNLTDDQLDFLLHFLFQKVNNIEKSELRKLENLNSVFQRFSHLHYWSCCDEVDKIKSDGIKAEIKSYFGTNWLLDLIEMELEENNLNTKGNLSNILPMKIIEPTLVDQVRADIQDMIGTNHDQNFTARAIARIFHGIGSPRYPAEVWGRVRKFWRCHINVDFHLILKMANETLMKLK